ncbi:hypothetical protein, partial [Desulfobulbus alkaliphilus]|uniref:hypothetical protein n=1 Tax=Desulfobulbus alkaliphilus TaxID=869814 RepID=UPI001965B43C
AIGSNVVDEGGNRIKNSFSEIAFFSTFIIFIYMTWKLFIFKNNIDKILLSIFLCHVVIFLIPTFKIFAGIFGLLMHQDIVWRFFFASPWFIFIPIVFFDFFKKIYYKKVVLFTSMLAIIFCFYFLSERILFKTFSGNIQSIYSSFSRDKVFVQYSYSDLKSLKENIDHHVGGMDKEYVMLYLRGDMATVARAIYGYYAFSHRRVFIPMENFYNQNLDTKYNLIPVDLPVNFPKDRNIFTYFDLDEKRISQMKKY